jgi:putative radical SAM enzyme (TIGR03279 family)
MVPVRGLCLYRSVNRKHATHMLEILTVVPGSIAEELGLQPGDRLQEINGEPVTDLLDYLLAEPDESLRLTIERTCGEVWELEIEHDRDEPLGIVLPHPEPQQCGNNCIFCFVHQLPRGMRRTLYVKDEDYRFSFLYGAYVTLTNLSEADLQRIISKRLSPLYVSVHAADPVLRQQMLGKPVADLMPLLQRLVDGGIDIHTQVVVCPEINDGAQLERTCRELAALAPGINSLAIVPVGLTGHRQRLPALRPQTREEAVVLVDWVEGRQAELLARIGTRFVFAADELYLKAGSPFPELEAYEDFAQIENGIGLIPKFLAQAAEVTASAIPLDLPAVSLVTGVSAAAVIKDFAARLIEKSGLDLRVHVVENRFFGGGVTVAGLLTGQDLIEQLASEPLGEILLVPEVMLREGEEQFLDDVSISDLAQRLDVEVEVVAADPWGIWDLLDTLAMERS